MVNFEGGWKWGKFLGGIWKQGFFPLEKHRLT